MIKPKSMKDPMFIKSYGWVIKTNFKVYKSGTTTKPLDFRKYWRANENRRGEGLPQQRSRAIELG